MTKLVVTDLDGTLLNVKSEISKDNYRAIKRIKEAGFLFGIASGRSVASIEKIIANHQITSLVDFIIGFNGAEVRDYVSNQSINIPQLKQETIQYVIEHLCDMDVAFAVHEANNLYASKWSPTIQIEADLNQYQLIVKEAFSEFIQKDYPKLMITAEENYLTQIEEQIISKLQGDYNCFRSHENFFEFVALGVSKGSSLKQYCQIHNILAKDVVAFGDNLNDYEMLEYAGMAIAMDNAVEPLKSIANKIARHHEDDGFSHMIENYIFPSK